MKGKIALNRELIDNEIWKKPPHYLKIWIWILVNARWKDNSYQRRGELFTSFKKIIKANYQKSGYRKTYLTKDQIYKVLKFLTETTTATTAKTTRGIKIKIPNYEEYQRFSDFQDKKNLNGDEHGDDSGDDTIKRKNSRKNSRNTQKRENGVSDEMNKLIKDNSFNEKKIILLLDEFSPDKVLQGLRVYNNHPNKSQIKSPIAYLRTLIRTNAEVSENTSGLNWDYYEEKNKEFKSRYGDSQKSREEKNK